MSIKRFFPAIDYRSLLLLVGTLCICLLVGEALMRVRMFGAKAWSYEQMYSLRHIGKSGLLQASAYQDILWELRPNNSSIYKLWPFRTNSQGLRDKEYSLQKPPGTFRVAVIGDSFTMAEGVPIEAAYHSLLEERFNQQGDGRSYEFINFGVPGYSLPQYVATIRHKALLFQPDVILIGFCAANDSKVPNMEAFKQPYKVKSPGNGFLQFHSLELLGNYYKYFYNKLRGRYPGYNADAGFVDEQFRQIQQLASSNKVPVVIAYIDNKAASSDFPIIQSAAKKYGFDFVDGTTGFGKEISDQHIIYLTDKHPNAAANQVFADTLFPALRALPMFAKP